MSLALSAFHLFNLISFKLVTPDMHSKYIEVVKLPYIKKCISKSEIIVAKSLVANDVF